MSHWCCAWASEDPVDNGRSDRSRDRRLDAPRGGADRHAKDLAAALEMIRLATAPLCNSRLSQF
jgi:hypothetical protein